MSKLIRNWKELSQVPANDKYRIIVNTVMCSGWIVPITDEPGQDDEFICHCSDSIPTKEYFDNHVYLSTHTFYGSKYEYSTKLLQEHGFDVEIDNWDKESES